MATPRNIRLFILADALLVVILVILVAVFLNRDGLAGDEDAQSPDTSASAAASASASATSTEPLEFALPSGNIACQMSVDGVTCTIASYTYAPPVVAGCTEVTGHVLVLNADGVAFDCVSGPPPAAAGADVPVLEYGSSTSVGEYTCRSATDGVQCTDSSGVGFQLARATWSELPA